MRNRSAITFLLLSTLTTAIGAQATGGGLAASPSFEVVSIKSSTGGSVQGGGNRQLPDGGMIMVGVSVMTLIARAYFPTGPTLMAGEPEWARRERFDITATAKLTNPTGEDRAAMLRAMLADRFKLVTHFEKRDHQAYDLVVAEEGGKLGSGLRPVDLDCSKPPLPLGATPTSLPDFTVPPPPCTLRSVGGALRSNAYPGFLMEGDASTKALAAALTGMAGRPVVDKTGLQGSYRVALNFERPIMLNAPAPRGNAPAATAPDLFTAVREQLGLRLVPVTSPLDTLVIDRLERPTEN